MLTIPILALVSGAGAATCPGCLADAEVNQDIVDFAVKELEGGEGGFCKKQIVSVENFKAQVFTLRKLIRICPSLCQVVAGMLYKFDLVLEHNPENPEWCEKAATSPETCHMVVYDVSWLKKTGVKWDQVDCAGNPFQL